MGTAHKWRAGWQLVVKRWWGGGEIEQEGLMDMDKSVVIAGGRGVEGD